VLLISACLLGLHTRYDRGTNCNGELLKLFQQGRAIPVCPEQLGGLPTPRPPAEIQGGTGHDVLAGRARVVSVQGDDFTEEFLRGAGETLYLAQTLQTPVAILKARSPSCGNREIYDGSHRGSLRPGVGVAAALLMENGITVYSEEDIEPALLAKLLER
jgi:uncharacterized protein YbbK (DUF523 family)